MIISINPIDYTDRSDCIPVTNIFNRNGLQPVLLFNRVNGFSQNLKNSPQKIIVLICIKIFVLKKNASQSKGVSII